MAWSEVLVAQVTDPFRIGLLVALVVTMLRTEGVTGRWVPLAAGTAFVAVIIPATLPQGGAEPFWRLVALGVVANAILLAAGLGLRELVLRLRR